MALMKRRRCKCGSLSLFLTNTHINILLQIHTRTHALSPSHTHTHSLSVTHTHTLSLSLSLTHTLSLSHTHSRALSLSHETHLRVVGASHGVDKTSKVQVRRQLLHLCKIAPPVNTVRAIGDGRRRNTPVPLQIASRRDPAIFTDMDYSQNVSGHLAEFEGFDPTDPAAIRGVRYQICTA